MATAVSPTITELCMALELARLRESWHQKGCRALMADTGCVSCNQYESEWLAADRDITVFLAGVERGAA